MIRFSSEQSFAERKSQSSFAELMGVTPASYEHINHCVKPAPQESSHEFSSLGEGYDREPDKILPTITSDLSNI